MKIGIIGTGAYGISLAVNLYKNNKDIVMWTKIEDEKDEIINTRYNSKTLDGIYIDEGIKVTTNMKDAVKDRDIVFLVVPVQFMKSTLEEMKGYVDNQVFVIASKGLLDGGRLLSTEVKEILETERIAVIGGGTFAIDMARFDISGLTASSYDEEVVKIVSNCLRNDNIKIQESNDTIGIEVCSSIKNVMAIIMGIANGLNLSETTKSMLMVEIINDIKMLINILGGCEETILTYAGVGDIILTCTSNKSRNFTFGEMLVKNKEEAHNFLDNNTVEGVNTLNMVYDILKDKNISINLIDKLYRIINENNDVNIITK